jgi:hypothetical protein
VATAAILPSEVPDDSEQMLSTEDESQEQQGDLSPTEQYGQWYENIPDELKDVVVKLAAKQCDEFRYPRRLEVMKAWQARSFWRENQHLTWNWEGECWDVLGPAGAKTSSDAGKYDSAVMYTTNTFQGFGESFIAIITQSTPNVRFGPEDVEEPADIESAKVADPMRKLIQHENDPIKLMTKAAYYAWTEGRIHGWTRLEVSKRTGKPFVKQSIEGAMEVKVPVIYEEDCEYPYLQYSAEYHVATVRDKVKKRAFKDRDYYKKIKGGSHGNGQDVYERTARISVKQGISMRSAGGDAYAHLVTTQRTWMRPTVFLEDEVEEQYRDQLAKLYSKGVYLEVDNGVYTGSRDATMDDEWSVENIMEGDGSFRNGKGTCLISVQERTNDIINVTQDVYEKTQPASHWDDKLFDLDGMKRQRSMPGSRYGINQGELPAGDQVSGHVFFEPAAQVSPDMLQYLKELMTDIPEFLTGISAILFGSDGGSGDKSGKALSIQQSAAMGRIGLPFRVLKRLYARMMEQAIRCAARNQKEDYRAGIPDSNGVVQTIAVRVGDLDGNVHCYADMDENYPESWVSKRATYMQLLQEGNTDPTMKAILANPENQNLAKRLIGLQELTIPDAASWDKQMMEIGIMLQEPPTPPKAAQVPNPLQPQTIETIQIPPQSTLSIDADYDNHVAEFMTVTIWVNSKKGQDAKAAQKPGFENIRLHGLLHKAEIQKAMAAQAAAAQPPGPPLTAPATAPHHGAPAAGAHGHVPTGAPPVAPPGGPPKPPGQV